MQLHSTFCCEILSYCTGVLRLCIWSERPEISSGGGLCSLVEFLILEDDSKEPSGDSCESRILSQAEDHQKPEGTAVQSQMGPDIWPDLFI